MRSPTRASELVTDVQEASLPPVREEDRHRPRGAAGRSRPEVLTADIRASPEGHLAGRLTTTRRRGPRREVRGNRVGGSRIPILTACRRLSAGGPPPPQKERTGSPLPEPPLGSP